MRPIIIALMLSCLTAWLSVAAVPFPELKDQTRVAAEPVIVPVAETPTTSLEPVVVASLHPTEAQPIPVPVFRRVTTPRSDTWLLARAQSYKGTNPTGWARLWCGKFMAMIAPDLAKKIDNPNWARDWAALPKAKPKPGVIVVLKRGKGGHVGVLVSLDKRGNPRVVSGNHNRKVAEAVYPKRRVLAYVSPQ